MSTITACDLSKKHCVPCEGGTPPLSGDEARKYLTEVSNVWQLSGNKIAAGFKFKDFREAIAFVNKVAELAESEGHHPDITIHYNKDRKSVV